MQGTLGLLRLLPCHLLAPLNRGAMNICITSQGPVVEVCTMTVSLNYLGGSVAPFTAAEDLTTEEGTLTVASPKRAKTMSAAEVT